MPAPKMCQSCWVTPAKVQLRGADGILRWRCNGCAEKCAPYKAKTDRQKLEARLFQKDTP